MKNHSPWNKDEAELAAAAELLKAEETDLNLIMTGGPKQDNQAGYKIIADILSADIQGCTTERCLSDGVVDPALREIMRARDAAAMTAMLNSSGPQNCLAAITDLFTMVLSVSDDPEQLLQLVKARAEVIAEEEEPHAIVHYFRL